MLRSRAPYKVDGKGAEGNFLSPLLSPLAPIPIALPLSLSLSHSLSILSNNHGEGKLPIASVGDGRVGGEADDGGAARDSGGGGDAAAQGGRRRRSWVQRRRRRRGKQHAPLLHRRRAGAQDVAHGGAGDEPLLHRLRHRAPRLRQDLSLPLLRRLGRRRLLISAAAALNFVDSLTNKGFMLKNT